ncbi:MAG: hypothetical protein MJ217_02310 [Bacilli bacterium]|nr:hypothetical protein [Bacilli bacterium]
MKKLKFLAPLLLSLALVGCGKPADASSKGNSSGECKHSWKTEEVITEATCQQKGKEKQKCSKCGAEQEVETKLASHKYVEDTAESKPATCQAAGEKVEKCSVCGDTKKTPIEKTDHTWVISEDQTGIENPLTCDTDGQVRYECSVCHEKEVRDQKADGHLYGEKQKAQVAEGVEYYTQECTIDGAKRYSWDASLVTAASKDHIREENGGWRFKGRPMGNDVQLDDDGNPSQDNHTAVPNPAQTGDFFEYEFFAPEAMNNAKLSAEILPASTLNNTDMFAAPSNVTSNDWTYGIKFADETDTTGSPIDDFRYVITVNGEKVVMDKSTYVATPGAGQKWYQFPGNLNLKAGLNTIRISMAGGWIHDFFQFGIDYEKKADGFNVTFDLDPNAQVIVYTTQACDVEDVAPYKTRNGDTGELCNDGVESQVNFKVVAPAGSTIKVTVAEGTFKNLKGPVETKLENVYRVTKVASDIKIKVELVSELHGFKVTFNLDAGVEKVIVYKTQTLATVDEPDSTGAYQTRNGKSGELCDDGEDSQLNFVVVLKSGKEINAVTAPEGLYNSIKQDPEKEDRKDVFRITKIKGDIVVTITTK